MTHIALLTTSFPVASDGREAAGSFVLDYATELARHCRVTVLAPGPAEAREHINDSLSVFRYFAPRQPLSLLKPHNPLHWPALVNTLLSGNRVLANLARNGEITYVFALWILPSGFWAWQNKRRTGIPYSTWALGSDIWSLGKIPVVRSILRMVLQGSDHNYADGYVLCNDVSALGKCACEFLPSTRHIEAPEPLPLVAPHSGYRLAFLGRWHPNKGTDLLLDALERLGDSAWAKIDAIRIHGGGPLERRIREQVARLADKGFPVTAGGYLSKSEAAQLISWSDYVLIPSRVESIPVVFSDAMKLARPVVITPVGDLTTLVGQHKCGVVADSVSADSYARALELALGCDAATFHPGTVSAALFFSLEASAKRLVATLGN